MLKHWLLADNRRHHVLLGILGIWRVCLCVFGGSTSRFWYTLYALRYSSLQTLVVMLCVFERKARGCVKTCTLRWHSSNAAPEY